MHLVHSDMGVRGVRAAVEHFQGWEVRWAVPEEAEAGAVDVHTMTREDIKVRRFAETWLMGCACSATMPRLASYSSQEHRERVRDAWLQRPLLHVLAATDACLGALGGALGVDVLVHVEPPAKRDALRRRQAAMFGGDAGAQEVSVGKRLSWRQIQGQSLMASVGGGPCAEGLPCTATGTCEGQGVAQGCSWLERKAPSDAAS